MNCGCKGMLELISPFGEEDRYAERIEFCPLHAAAEKLRDALMEMRDVSAAAFRFSRDNNTGLALVDYLKQQGIKAGFGVRADQAIAAAEGEA